MQLIIELILKLLPRPANGRGICMAGRHQNAVLPDVSRHSTRCLPPFYQMSPAVLSDVPCRSIRCPPPFYQMSPAVLSDVPCHSARCPPPIAKKPANTVLPGPLNININIKTKKKIKHKQLCCCYRDCRGLRPTAPGIGKHLRQTAQYMRETSGCVVYTAHNGRKAVPVHDSAAA